MRDEGSGWITLHPGEFYLLWTECGFGEPPALLGVPAAGRTPTARVELIELADEGLAARDLGSVREPARDLGHFLRVLSAPETMLDLIVTGEESEFRSLGAMAGGDAVSIGVTDDEVRVGPVRRTALAATMVDAAPDLPAGPGRAGNAQYADYSRACEVGDVDGASGFLDVLRDAGVRAPEASTFLRAVSKREGGGMFGASTQGRGGSWIRTSSTVNWVDTDEGRYAMRRNGDWVTVTPVDRQRLLSMIEEMIADL